MGVVPSTDRPAALAEVELVVEAIPERMDLKKAVLAEASLEAPKVDLIVRWAVAEFEQHANMHERWVHAYQIASDFGATYSAEERKAVMADLRAIAEADGFIDAREKRLLAELGQRCEAAPDHLGDIG